MNYDHAYHAGNFADVFKHSILCTLLHCIQKKDKPCVYIDSHAGMGLYSLNDARAQKTQEAKAGVLKLFEDDTSPPAITRYVKKILPYISDTTKMYPGSPSLLRDYLRPDDRLIINELNPKIAATLKRNLEKNRQVSIHQRDGYEFLHAVLPPKIRRALILIDPPFEKKDEYAKIQNSLTQALAKFSTGIYAIWYPIVKKSNSTTMRRIQSSLKHESLLVEIHLSEIYRDNRGLSGSGLLIVNPPWQCEKDIRKIAEYLSLLFGSGSRSWVTHHQQASTGVKS